MVAKGQYINTHKTSKENQMRTVLLLLLLGVTSSGFAQQPPQYPPPRDTPEVVLKTDTVVRVVAASQQKPASAVTRPASPVRREQQSASPDRFDTWQACKSALERGQVTFYHPTYFKPKQLMSGERVLPLESNACVRMQIVGRVAWVPQAQGTPLVFHGTEPVRREDCGNRVYAIVYPDTPSPVLGAVPPTVAPPVYTVPERVCMDTQAQNYGVGWPCYYPPPLNPPTISRSPWIVRNWWAVPLGVVAGCTISGFVFDEWCITIRQKQTVRM